MAERRPRAEALQAGDGLWLAHGSLAPGAGHPEVGGESQVAALWNTTKPLQTTCCIFRDACQILALDIIFQVFLLEKGLIWRLREGGNKKARKEEPS